jgi:hypothetical protein
MGTQREIARKIIENSADYILPVKGNQKELQEEVLSTCKHIRSISDTSILEKGHGRIETRRCEIFAKGFFSVVSEKVCDAVTLNFYSSVCKLKNFYVNLWVAKLRLLF